MHRRLLIFALMFSSFSAWALEEPELMKKKSFDKPLREVSLIYTDEGYYPQFVTAFAGEKVRLFLTATSEKPGCLLMPGKDVFLSAEKGKVSEGEIYFDKPGKYKFYCPNGKVFGNLTVLERPEVVREKEQRELRREVASEKPKVLIWMPREDE